MKKLQKIMVVIYFFSITKNNIAMVLGTVFNFVFGLVTIILNGINKVLYVTIFFLISNDTEV